MTKMLENGVRTEALSPIVGMVPKTWGKGIMEGQPIL